MTVEQLLNNISSEELTEWQGFERLEPFGSIPLRYQLARFMAMFYNAVPGKRKTVYPEIFLIGKADYLLGKPDEPRKQSIGRIKRIFTSMLGKNW